MNRSTLRCWQSLAACAIALSFAAPTARAGDPKLTPDQRRAIRDLRDDLHKTVVQLDAKLEVATIDLRRELERDQPDPKTAGALIEQIAELEGKIRKARVLAALRVRALLDAPQRETLSQPPAPQPDRPGLRSFEDAMRAQKAESAKRGTVLINATPYAEVFVDGEAKGMTPARLELPAGRHVVELRRAGYDTAQKTVEVEPGKSARVMVKLNED